MTMPRSNPSSAPSGARGVPRIGVVIVTFHNPAMLRTILESLRAQTLSCRPIVVFDNSADGETRAMVTGEFPDVRLLAESGNVGSAGGFCAAMACALPECDFILTLDDDVAVCPDAVEELYRGFRDLAGRGIPVGAVRAAGFADSAAAPYRIAWFPWRGTLIASAAVRAVGLPRRDYFMYAEDAEFSLRLARRGYRFYCIPRSRVEEIRTDGKLYDRFLGREFFYYADDFRSYYATRNFICLFREQRRRAELVRTVLYGVKLALFTALFSRRRSLSRTHAILSGFRDGFRGRLGRNARFLPDPPAAAPAERGAGR